MARVPGPGHPALPPAARREQRRSGAAGGVELVGVGRPGLPPLGGRAGRVPRPAPPPAVEPRVLRRRRRLAVAAQLWESFSAAPPRGLPEVLP